MLLFYKTKILPVSAIFSSCNCWSSLVIECSLPRTLVIIPIVTTQKKPTIVQDALYISLSQSKQKARLQLKQWTIEASQQWSCVISVTVCLTMSFGVEMIMRVGNFIKTHSVVHMPDWDGVLVNEKDLDSYLCLEKERGRPVGGFATVGAILNSRETHHTAIIASVKRRTGKGPTFWYMFREIW